MEDSIVFTISRTDQLIIGGMILIATIIKLIAIWTGR